VCETSGTSASGKPGVQVATRARSQCGASVSTHSSCTYMEAPKAELLLGSQRGQACLQGNSYVCLSSGESWPAAQSSHLCSPSQGGTQSLQGTVGHPWPQHTPHQASSSLLSLVCLVAPWTAGTLRPTGGGSNMSPNVPFLSKLQTVAIC
jgi:hypothetical protein